MRIAMDDLRKQQTELYREMRFYYSLPWYKKFLVGFGIDIEKFGFVK